MGFVAQDGFARLFYNDFENPLIGDWIADVLEDLRNLVLQMFVLFEGYDARRFASLQINVNVGGAPTVTALVRLVAGSTAPVLVTDNKPDALRMRLGKPCV